MSERDLKHYDKYLDILQIYAKVIGIKIQFTNYEQDGCWIPSARKVKIDPNMSQMDEISTILHELGHAIDDAFEMSGGQGPLDEAYIAMYAEKATKPQKKLVIKAERKAWENGRVIAKLLGIRLGKWYTDIAKQAIDDYKKS